MSTRPAPRPARLAVRRAATVAAGVVTVAGVLLGHPTPVAPVTAGAPRTRCARACRGRCRSAVRTRPLLP